MIKQKGLKAIIISLLIILLTTCFSLLYTNIYKTFTAAQPQAASVWNFDNGGFGNGSFWDIVKDVFGNITYKDVATYKSYTNFEISSEKGFTAFAGSVSAGYDFSGKTVTLTCDLDFDGDSFLPVGAKITTSNGKITAYQFYDDTFNGTFDGGSHTISNVTINSKWESSTFFEGSTPIGLFCMLGAHTTTNSQGYVSAYGTYNCVVKNLHINNMSITETSGVSSSIGAIAGAMGTLYNSNGYMNKNTVSIQNCAITNFKVYLANDSRWSFVSGLVGISRVYNPSSCTEPKITDCLVYTMSVTNKTINGNEVAALSPAHGIWYNGGTLIYCPFFTLKRCINYESTVDSASLYYYPDNDGYFSYHMSTLSSRYGEDYQASYGVFKENCNNVYSVNANDCGGEDCGNQISNATILFDSGSFCNYRSYQILGGPNLLTNNGAWFVACYKDSSDNWYDTRPSEKIYLKDFLTTATFTKSGSGADLITTSALVPKGVIATENNKILNVDMFYTNSTTYTDYDFDIFAQNKPVDGSSVLRWDINNATYTYTAVFQETQYTVTFDGHANTNRTTKETATVTLSQSPKVTVTYSSTSCSFKLSTNSTTYTYTPNTGYKLTGYKVGGTTYTTASKTVTISGNTTFEVVVQNIQYTLTFSTVTPYTTRSGNQTYTVNHGTTIAVSQTATTCSYTFNSTTVTYTVANASLYKITNANLNNNFTVSESITIQPSAEQYAIYVQFNNSTGDYTTAAPSRTDQFTIAYNANADEHYTITNTMPDNGIENKTLTYTLNGSTTVTYTIPAIYVLESAGINKAEDNTIVTITPQLHEKYMLVIFKQNNTEIKRAKMDKGTNVSAVTGYDNGWEKQTSTIHLSYTHDNILQTEAFTFEIPKTQYYAGWEQEEQVKDKVVIIHINIKTYTIVFG